MYFSFFLIFHYGLALHWSQHGYSTVFWDCYWYWTWKCSMISFPFLYLILFYVFFLLNCWVFCAPSAIFLMLWFICLMFRRIFSKCSHTSENKLLEGLEISSQTCFNLNQRLPKAGAEFVVSEFSFAAFLCWMSCFLNHEFLFSWFTPYFGEMYTSKGGHLFSLFVYLKLYLLAG